MYSQKSQDRRTHTLGFKGIYCSEELSRSEEHALLLFGLIFVFTVVTKKPSHKLEFSHTLVLNTVGNMQGNNVYTPVTIPGKDVHTVVTIPGKNVHTVVTMQGRMSTQ